MPQAAHDWTVERVLALPDDGNRYEVVDGELLVTPSPGLQHQDAVLALGARLLAYTQAIGVGHVVIAPADVQLDGRTLVQPDVFVFDPPASRPLRLQDVHTLLLAIEVSSPSTARFDRVVKRLRYQRQGIPEYWIVDLDSRLFERWLPRDERPEILYERIAWAPDAAKGSLTIDIRDFFASILDV